MSTVADALHDHLTLCEEVHAILLEENRRYKGGNLPADEANDPLLQRKQALLPRLEEGATRLRSAREEGFPVDKDLLRKAQNKLMKVILLDRENEQYLLQASVRRVPDSLRRRVHGDAGLYTNAR